MIAVLVILIALLLTLACHLLYITRPKKEMQGLPVPPDDDIKNHIVWMFFYCNPDDPRGWVGKTHGPGITPNFRTKDNILVFISLIAAIQFCAVSMAVFLILKAMA